MSTAANLFEIPTAQAGFAFPEPLTEKYRPHTFDEFVGLEKIRKCMARLAANPFPSAWLFIGPSGTGKTTMCEATARSSTMARRIANALNIYRPGAKGY